MSTWQSYLSENSAGFVDDLVSLLRFPSLSGDPANRADVAATAAWVSGRMSRAGIENVRLIGPESHPVVYGDWLHASDGAPTILIYGHYDVQPADPLELWTTPPFEPVIRDGRIYARGAADMKANLLLSMIALEAVLKSGGTPRMNLKFMFEGQEEIGSPDLPGVIAANAELLACDLAVSADSLQLSEDQPAVWLGTRGVSSIQIDVKGPAADLHSGLYGGAVQNPLHAIVELVASMHDRDGRVTVSGFYDDVVPISGDERRRSVLLPVTDDYIKGLTGVQDVFGEAGYTSYERSTSRPTLEVNGIWGGYTGEGQKTVIPSEAHVKITCRLVANQDPKGIIASIEKHVREHTPIGVAVTVTPFSGLARPYAIGVAHPGNQIISEILTEIYATPPIPIRIGGTVPVYDTLRSELGADAVMLGFSASDEPAHSPNEFTRLSSFRRGQEAYCRLLIHPGLPTPASLRSPTPAAPGGDIRSSA